MTEAILDNSPILVQIIYFSFSMGLFDTFLIFSLAASIAGFYFYSKEKRMIREFIQQSRRHDHHKELDVVMQKKANRYLLLSLALSFISLPLLIQKILDLFE